MKRSVMGACLMVVMIAAVWGTSSAATIAQRYEFSEPLLEEHAPYVRVSMEGTRPVGAPGEPLMPAKGVILLLPPGESIAGVQVIPGDRVVLEGTYVIQPADREYPFSYDGPYLPIEPDEDIYASPNPYPEELFEGQATRFLCGHSLGTLVIYPVEYTPATGQIAWYRSLKVVLETKPAADAQRSVSRFLRSTPLVRSRVAGLVDNAGELLAYGAEDKSKDADYDYVIITNQAMESTFQTLADHKTRRGVKTTIKMVEDILSEYSGVDDADKIRNFIIDAYTTWGIEYVLLGGDGDGSGAIIPHRGLYNMTHFGSYEETDTDIASDLYYGGLDRVGTGSGPDWNADDDSYWGERDPEEADLIADVFVGRLAVDDAAEAQNFIDKIIAYEESPVTGECTEALMAGELLWSDPTYGGDYKDEIKNGASTWGYTTVGFPGHFNVPTLYDRDGPTWSATGDLLPLLNGGVHLVNHLGHANVTYALRFYDTDVTDANFTNDGVGHSFYIIYTQGCYCNSFDNRDTDGSYTSDAISEAFTTIQHSAVAFVGNTRYGWGMHESTDGSSQYYDRQFFDALFGEEIYNIGKANEDSKVDNIPYVDLNKDAIRWCHYEICLLGDPEMPIWTDTPVALDDVSYPPTVPIGASDFTVAVNHGGSPVEDALVCVRMGGEVYERDRTNASGQVTLSIAPTSEDTLYVSVKAHDHLPYDGTALVIASGKYVSYYSHQIDDAAGGNGDGLVNAGETIELPVTVKNYGTETAYDVSAILRNADAYVTITDSTESYGDIPADSLAVSLEDYDFSVDLSCPDGHVIAFDLEVRDDLDSTWTSQFPVTVAAADLAYQSHSVDDAVGGNGNGLFEPGETADVTVQLANGGGADAFGVSATISESDPYITVGSSSADYGDIPAAGSGSSSPPYTLTADGGCPTPHYAELVMDITATGGFAYLDTFVVTVGTTGFDDDVESGEGEWSHGIVTAGYGDQWHISTARSNSTSHAWKCGDTAGGNYGDLLDAGLVTPTIFLAPGSVLKFWHWIDAETYNSTRAWDAGIVEISTDGGGSWDEITPQGGYPYTIWDEAASAESPFAVGTPCFSGTHDWQQEEFDLAAYSGEVKIRFRFGTDVATNQEGWYIDDIYVGAPPAFDLSDPGVSPLTGDDSTAFTYSVTYTSADNYAPTTAQVTIDGQAHTMSTADYDYTDGSEFTYQTALGYGSHAYCFLFSYGSTTARMPASGQYDGPFVGELIYGTDFESSSDWTQDPSHTASTGAFVRIDPNGTDYQPEDDATPAPGVYGWITAQNSAVGTDDVDEGVAATCSPVIDLSAYGSAHLSMKYFHGQRDVGDDPSGDFYRIDVSNDGGASYPANLVSIGDVSSAATWRSLEMNLDDVIALTDEMRLRVQAADGTADGDIVEGGVDDIVVLGIPEVPPAVTDLVSQVSQTDIVLTWNPPAMLSIDHYVIYRGVDPQFDPQAADSIGSTGDTVFVDPGAAKALETSYFYVIKAVGAGGQKSEPSNRVGEFDRLLENEE
jgi:hypothetical protein